MTIEITEASTQQAALVHRVMQAAFAEYAGHLNPPPECLSETVADVAQAMQSGGAVLAWLDGVIVGSARYRLHPDYFHIERVSVLPGYRGHGIASIMMQYLEEMARVYRYPQAQLETRLSLPRNVALYERLGYQIVHQHQESPDADVQVTMVKPLEEPVLA